MQAGEQRSLFDARGDAPILQSLQWIERVVLGEIALLVCVIAVALIGALMLTGRWPLREGIRVVVGCFVLLGAQVIAFGLMQDGGRRNDTSPLVPPIAGGSEVPRADMPPANYDPYAGASLGDR